MQWKQEEQSYFKPSIFPPEFVPQESIMQSLDLRRYLKSNEENQTLKDNGKIDKFKPHASQDQESMHVAIRPYLLLGQCFGMVPVCGFLKNNPSSLRFSWKAKRVIYSILLLLASTVTAALQTSSSIILRGLTYRNIVDIISMLLCILEITLCLRQAQTWPRLISEWTCVEQRMKHLHPIVKYNRKVKVLVYTYFFGAILLFVAQISNYMYMLRRCSQDPFIRIKLAMVAFYYPYFYFLGFSTVTTTVMMCFTMHHFVVVIYDELTITVLSYCLAVKFRQLNGYIFKLKNQRLPWTFWAEMREIFNSLSLLTKQLDSHLGLLTFMCFGSNLYYNCSLLLDMLSGHMRNAWASVFILLFTLTRTFLAALAASYIAEDSKKPLASLFSVTSDSYNIEVARFQAQVTHDDVVITGCKFFSVTRSFILTVAGTIMTYEIVLLQFGNNLESTGTTNHTAQCLKIMNIIS